MSFFRKEAVFHQSVRLAGDISLAQPLSISEQIANLNMTRVMIAHRQETIAKANRVLVLEQGLLVDMEACLKTGTEG